MAQHRAVSRTGWLPTGWFRPRRPADTTSETTRKPLRPVPTAPVPETPAEPIPVKATCVELTFPNGERHEITVVNGLQIRIGSTRFVAVVPERRIGAVA